MLGSVSSTALTNEDQTPNSSPESEAPDSEVPPASKGSIKQLALTRNTVVRNDTVENSDLRRESELIGTPIPRIYWQEIGRTSKRKRRLLPKLYTPTAGLTVAEYNDIFLTLAETK